MSSGINISLSELLQFYPVELHICVEEIRNIIKKTLPGITEQVDMPAKMIAFCYGQKYAEMICALFPSKKGLKLSFYKGTEFNDPAGLLQGSAKTTRYLVIDTAAPIQKDTIVQLLKQAQALYIKRMDGSNSQ